MTMYAGGPGGDPYMGLLGMSDPRTSVPSGTAIPPGLLSMGPWSQMAYQMAGRPQQGPYAAVPVPTAIPGSIPSASAGSSGGSGVLGGLLGTVARNPKLVSQTSNLVNGLLGTTPAAYGSGAIADAAVGSAVAPAVASDASGIAAGNSAWLASQPAASGTLYGGAAAGADAAGTGAAAGSADAGATGASSAGLGATAGAATAAALPLALALYASQTNPTDAGAQYNSQLAKSVQPYLTGGINAQNSGDAQALMSSLWSWGKSGDAPAMNLYNQLSPVWDQYTNNLMQQRALAAGFPSVDAMNAAANASGSLMSGRGGATKGTVRV